jgi:alpha-1,6-mannosyltransferase
MPLKTLHLTNAWHATSGGIKSFYLELIKRANQCGHPIRIVVPGAESKVEQAGPFGKIYYVQSGEAPLNDQYRMIYPPKFLKPDGPVVQILNEEKPDVVEICDKYTLPYLGGLIRIGKLRGFQHKPTVIGLSCERMNENMAAYLTQGWFGQSFSRLYMKAIYFAQFDHHITVSQHAAEELRVASRGHKVQRGVWVAPMGVSSNIFTPQRRSREVRDRILNEHGIGPDRTLLLYAGRLVPEKNLWLILDSLEKLHAMGGKPFHLLVAGTGNLQADFERQAADRLPGMVTMLGHVQGRDALADLYANCDIFVHPNPREPFGIAPLEAMASGMALVAPNSGGVTTYANTLNSWLTDPTPDAFAQAISVVIRDPEGMARKQAAARGTAEKYSWEVASDRFLQLYEQLHARTQGLPIKDEIPAAFYSTPGNYFGMELKKSAGDPSGQLG